MLARAVRRTFARGATVFNAGDEPDGVHILLRGRVAVAATTPAGDQATFTVLGPGDVVGEMALLGRAQRRSGTVRALEATSTLVIGADDLTALRRADTEIDAVLLDVLAERIRRLSDHLLEALYLPADKRIVRRLIVLCRAYHGASVAATVPLAQAELASLAGTTRQSVNKMLRTLAADGVVTLSRSSVTVPDPRRLTAYAK